jgi:hypothetical protein
MYYSVFPELQVNGGNNQVIAAQLNKGAPLNPPGGGGLGALNFFAVLCGIPLRSLRLIF